MGVIASQLIAKVGTQGVDTSKRELQSMGEAAKETSGGFKSMLGNALSFAAGQAVFNLVGNAVGFLKNQVSDSISLAMQHQDVMEQTAKVLKSTGDASGMTQQALEALASSLEKTTFFSKDQTEAGENMLLTFTNIGKDVFPLATKTMLDMSRAMGQDVKSTAIMMGKALDDPATGLTALTRVGVTFSAQQQDMIKQMVAAGDTAGAQKIMLQELQREFGGSADATTTLGGKWTILTNRLNDFKERAATAVMPALSNLTDTISNRVFPALDSLSNWISSAGVPAFENFGQQALKSLNLGNIHLDSSSLLSGFKNLSSSLNSEFGPQVRQIADLLQGQFVDSFKFAGQQASQISKWFQGSGIIKDMGQELKNLAHVALDLSEIFLKARGVVLDVAEHAFAKFTPYIEKILPPLIKFQTTIDTGIAKALQYVKPYVLEALGAFEKFADGVIDRVSPIVDKLMPLIISGTQNTEKVWVAVWPYLQEVLEGTFKTIVGVVQVAWSIVSGIINVGLDLLSGNWGQAWKDMRAAMSGVWDGIRTMLGGELQAVEGLLSGVLSMVDNRLVGPFRWALGQIGGIFGNIGKLISDATAGSWTSIPGDLRSLHIPGFASGTSYAPGGLAQLAENGMELVTGPGVGYLPRGARVYSASQTQQMLGSGSTASGDGQPIILQIDGRTFARGYMPYHVEAARNIAGVRF